MSTPLPTIQVKMYDEAPVRAFQTAFGGYMGSHGPYGLNRQAHWMWYAHYRRALRVAVQLRPWCRNPAKQQQLDKIIDHYRAGVGRWKIPRTFDPSVEGNH